jgi:tetratricopeptide (TPR) repeat protein
MRLGRVLPAIVFVCLAPAVAEAQTARELSLKRGYDFEETLYVDCVEGFALRNTQGDACEKLLNSDELREPQTSADYARLSAVYSALGQYERAVEAGDAAINLDSKNAAAFGVRGAARWNLQNTAAAAADFERALQLDPENPDAQFGCGAVHFRNGEFDRALERLDIAISLKPEFTAAFVYRGETRTWLQQYDEAIADFDTAARLDPGDWRPLLSRGNVHLTLADYEAAIAIAPDLGASHNSRAWVLATAPDPSIRDGAAALAEAQIAVGLDDSDPDFYDTLAAAYAETGDIESAVAAQETAVSIWRDQRDIPSMRSGEERLAMYQRREPFREIR